MRAVFAGGPATQRLDDPSRDFPWLRPELRQVTIP